MSPFPTPAPTPAPTWHRQPSRGQSHLSLEFQMFKFVSASLALVAGALSVNAQAGGYPRTTEDASVVTQWNSIAEANIPASAGVTLPRTFAMMHVAMFDAVNSIEGGYSPYRVRLPALRFASSE